ncbi:FMN-binding protein [Kribbella sp. NPDC051718]|uniref:FMN-binding protein n=1 Tax=Kribbella sp. NPDC051718 TaxID=3155168 RepID=UPI003437A40E
MRRGVVRTMSVATLAVVGLGLRAGAQPSSSSPPSVTSTPAGRPRHVRVRPSPARTVAPRLPVGTPSATASTAPKKASAHATTAAAGFQGDLVDTQYGPVRVRITVRQGRIKRAQAIEHPQGDGTTDGINAYAVPALDREAVAAQSAHIDAVSGATFTSEGYRQSLQSALDAAHQAGAL